MPAAMTAIVTRIDMKMVIRMKYLLDFETRVCVKLDPGLSSH
jgi:hypothetical protein